MVAKITIARTGHQFDVQEGESILEAALRQRLLLPYGCRNGSCGSCKAKILAGQFECGDHDPSALTEAERQQGLTLLCRTEARGDLTIDVDEVRDATDLPVRRMPARLEKLEQLAPDVMRLILKLSAGQRLQYFAGQYLDVILKDGKKRSFSIANRPGVDDHIELHVRNVHGVFSDLVFHHLKEKAVLRIEGPYGQFYLREDSPRTTIFVAGGTGFAPIKAILEHALERGIRRQLFLYWGARTRADLYLDELPNRWATEVGSFRYIPVLSQAADNDDWVGRQGLVHSAVFEDFSDFADIDVYSAGPPPMVRAVWDGVMQRGLGKGQFFSDPFEPARDKPSTS